jgi:hypothetical protein
MKTALLIVPVIAVLLGAIPLVHASTTHFQQTCDDGSKTDFKGMCHYPICPDGSTPVGSGTCVGFGVGECIHAADANGNCMGPTFCGGTSVNGFCPVTPPTNTSMTLPPLRCDQLGYVSCHDFGREAGNVNGPQVVCPELSLSNANNANKSQTDNYCLGFKAGQADQLRPQTRSPSLPNVIPPMHIKALATNQTSAIASKGNTSIAFDLPATITNVYFSIYAEVVGNNFTEAPDVNPQLYDITECHKTITATDLQPNAKCGISVLDARELPAMNGSIEHLRLPAGRNISTYKPSRCSSTGKI